MPLPNPLGVAGDAVALLLAFVHQSFWARDRLDLTGNSRKRRIPEPFRIVLICFDQLANTTTISLRDLSMSLSQTTQVREMVSSRGPAALFAQLFLHLQSSRNHVNDTTTVIFRFVGPNFSQKIWPCCLRRGRMKENLNDSCIDGIAMVQWRLRLAQLTPENIEH